MLRRENREYNSYVTCMKVLVCILLCINPTALANFQINLPKKRTILCCSSLTGTTVTIVPFLPRNRTSPARLGGIGVRSLPSPPLEKCRFLWKVQIYRHFHLLSIYKSVGTVINVISTEKYCVLNPEILSTHAISLRNH